MKYKSFFVTISEYYLRNKYGMVYTLKPPLGYSNFCKISIYKKICYWYLHCIWYIDSKLDNFSGTARKKQWMVSRKFDQF